MNFCDAFVTEVLGTPYKQYGKWWLAVRYDCWGSVSTTKLMFDTQKEALQVVKGYQFIT